MKDGRVQATIRGTSTYLTTSSWRVNAHCSKYCGGSLGNFPMAMGNVRPLAILVITAIVAVMSRKVATILNQMILLCSRMALMSS